MDPLQLAAMAALVSSTAVQAVRAELDLLPRLSPVQPALPLSAHLQQAADAALAGLQHMRGQYASHCAAAQQQGDSMQEEAVRQVRPAVRAAANKLSTEADVGLLLAGQSSLRSVTAFTMHTHGASWIASVRRSMGSTGVTGKGRLQLQPASCTHQHCE